MRSHRQTIHTLAAGATAQIAAETDGRAYLAIMVIGTGRVTLGLDTAPTADLGWALAAAEAAGAQGGGIVWEQRGTVPQNALWARAAADTVIAVVEA